MIYGKWARLVVVGTLAGWAGSASGQQERSGQTSAPRAATKPAAAKKESPAPGSAAQAGTDARAPAGPPPGGQSELPLLRRAASLIEGLIEPPRTVEEYWLALDRDLRFGLIDDAKRHLSELLGRSDLTAEKALELREQYGSSLLIKLELNPELAGPAKKLVDMANAAALAKARDVKRIRHFLGNLSKSAGERQYAILQLRRSGAWAIPHFVEALRQPDADRLALLEGLLAMNASAWPAVAAVLESDDEALMAVMIDVLRNLAVPESADALWYVAAAPKYSKGLRAQAQDALSELTGIPVGDLPSSVTMLARNAERDYQSRATLGEAAQTTEVWRWERGGLVSSTDPESDALENRAMKAAGLALELDPNCWDAKMTMLSLGLHTSFEKIGIDQPLPAGRRGVFELTLSAGPELLVDVLRKAVRERRNAVALGAVQALGRTGNANLLASGPGQPAPLLQALDYPNARVQFAGALAALNIHPHHRFDQCERVVQTLVRALDANTQPVALVLDADPARGNETSALLQQLGYETRVFRTGRDGFRSAADSSAVDLVVIEPTIQNWPLAETLTNFRADARTAGVSIAIVGRPEAGDSLDRFQREFEQVERIPAFQSKGQLAKALELSFRDPMAKPLSVAEKSANQQAALEWVLRLSRGELPYFDVWPAGEPLAGLLGSPELGAQAAEALGYLPSARNQARLAEVVLTESRSLPVRLAACNALARNVQRAGRAVDSATAAKLLTLFEQAKDQELRMGLARLAGTLGPEGRQVAQRMLKLRSVAPPELESAPGSAPTEPTTELKPKEPPLRRKPAGKKSADASDSKAPPNRGNDE